VGWLTCRKRIRVVESIITAIITGEETSWLTKPPPVTSFDGQEQAVHLWVVLEENEYQRSITRAHHRWRENSFHPDHPTLSKNLDRLRPYRVTFLWNDLGSKERKVIPDYSWEEKWVEEKLVGYMAIHGIPGQI